MWDYTMEEVCIGSQNVPGVMILHCRRHLNTWETDSESDFNGASPQFTLTCLSTGGPATTVTWTRDNGNITAEQNETVLNDPVPARYTHTLTIAAAGVYMCMVSNNKPSTASASITFESFSNMIAHFYRSISSHYCDSSPGWSH